MTRAELVAEVVKPTLDAVSELFIVKGNEYAKTGAFHNFENAAKKLSVKYDRIVSPIEALDGMAMKHEVSIEDMLRKYQDDFIDRTYAARSEKDVPDITITSLVQIDEKFNDLITYLILKKALLIDFYHYSN